MALARELGASLLLILGSLLLLVAAIGVLRMPDIFLRMSAVSKASSLGGGLMLLAAALSHPDATVAVRAVAAILFLFLTAPVASHLIGRAAYRLGVPRWRGTAVDDLQRDGYPVRSNDVQGT
jgi:multicomponent Na+:H+ antiporter subunit G